MLEGHISKAFDGDLAALHLRTLEMGGLVLDQVREAARAYTEWDALAAELVVDRVPAVAEYDASLDRDELTLIARRQPVSRDLRAILALAKCVAELHRAAAEARKIALTVLRQDRPPALSTSADVRHLADLALSLLRRALEALDRIDREAAGRVMSSDEELDAEYAAGLRRLLSHAMEEPRHLEIAMDAAFVLKAFEHIGDNARNIARHVCSIVPDEEARAPGEAGGPTDAGGSPEPAGPSAPASPS